jgi:site-specific DNA-cytosine methylase
MGNIEVEAYLRESKVKDRTRILNINGVNQALRATDYKDPTKIMMPIDKGYERIAHAPYNNGRMDGRTGVFSAESGVPALNATMGKEPYKVAIETEKHKDSHDGIYVKLSEDVVAYAIWYERYKCYIAIRKLTPRECFRLQGWSDDYFERAAFVNSNSQLYKQAGNGVTVNVIQAIAEKMK